MIHIYDDVHFQRISARNHTEQRDEHPKEQNSQLDRLLVLVALVNRQALDNPRH